jgi:hypothetical protein
MFEDPTRYDFSRVGRLKFNTKLYGDEASWPEPVRERWQKLEDRTASREDFVAAVGYLLGLRSARGTSTTSTTWGTGACAAWVSSWRTSSASAWCGWSGPSRRRCPSTRR